MIEYKILSTDKPTASEAQLSDLGKDGWELVTIVNWNNTWYYYFKRLKGS